jgi:hypothetical protein
MSGGSYDYVSGRIEDAATTLRRYHREQPHVVALSAHLDAIAKVMRDIEWADSCDTSWRDQLDADIRALLAPGAELRVATEQAIRARDSLSRVLDAAVLRSSHEDEPKSGAASPSGDSNR